MRKACTICLIAFPTALHSSLTRNTLLCVFLMCISLSAHPQDDDEKTFVSANNPQKHNSKMIEIIKKGSQDGGNNDDENDASGRMKLKHDDDGESALDILRLPGSSKGTPLASISAAMPGEEHFFLAEHAPTHMLARLDP